MIAPYPKRLIEVDLPIREISGHARREKSVGPISTLHIWWARRPLAACRAVLCASLWPDPADERCPQAFRDAAAAEMCRFAEHVRTEKRVAELSAAHWARWNSTDSSRLRPSDPTSWLDIRHALLDFISDFAAWTAARNELFQSVARALTAAAHRSLTGEAHTRPSVIDPFSGGGAIPLEAMRLGADALASDLNPVAVTLEKALLEFVSQRGDAALSSFRDLAPRVREVAAARLGDVYAAEPGGVTPIAFLWARTVHCEGPGCGVIIPLLRSGVLAKRGRESVILRRAPAPPGEAMSFKVTDGALADAVTGTIKNGHATCPNCGFTTSNERVRAQLSQRGGGAAEAKLMAIVGTVAGERGRRYVEPTPATFLANERAVKRYRDALKRERHGMSLIPDEPISLARPSPNARGLSPVASMGFKTFRDFFSPRQALALTVFQEAIDEVLADARLDKDLEPKVATLFALSLDRLAEHATSLCRWNPSGQKMQATFGRQALPIVWDFCEANPFGGSVGSWESMVDCVAGAFDAVPRDGGTVSVSLASATELPVPDDAVDVLFTDPPYYDSIPYADLSEFFYVWLRRSLVAYFPDLFSSTLVDKTEEAIWNPSRTYGPTGKPKDKAFYEAQMARALTEARRVVRPNGIGVVVFAHTSTEGWEAMLGGLVSSGWVVTASWPVDTEMGTRMNAMGTASLASSVHLVCRPREDASGRTVEAVGAWRQVLLELPGKMHEWLPRLAQEGVVGADAIFACLGPALEIFSRYSRVEKASGEPVLLREYLEQVWAAVAREALSVMFEGADASGLEEDARLTAMWLWTLGAGKTESIESAVPEEDELGEEGGVAAKTSAGFVLEYDAARKIAQGLGAHLEKLTNVVEVKGDKARLLTVAERAKALFTKASAPTEGSSAKQKGKGKPSKKQLGLFAEIEAAEQQGLLGDAGVPSVGETTLDRLHQAMILFAAGRSEAVRRFIVEDGVGKDARFWQLAQSFSALYPTGSDEKRWVDGVLARKKSLGF